jgi:hypothetical protein
MQRQINAAEEEEEVYKVWYCKVPRPVWCKQVPCCRSQEEWAAGCDAVLL